MNDSVSKTREHGGDPKAVEARFGVPKDGWLDLSTGINPIPYALSACPDPLMHRLPLQKDMDALLAAARRAYDVPEGAVIVASPGTQALIQLVPSLFKPSTVSIVSPTYGEHAPAWRSAGHQVVEVAKLDVSTPYGLVVHPNNPDGRVQTVAGLLQRADEMFAKGGGLVVDEAFCDVVPGLSVTPHAGREGLIVLRSFGKFFGLAGVRLGFAICSLTTAERLLEKMGPWAVSGPALWAGTQALNDQAWIEATRQRLQSDTSRLDNLLCRAGLIHVGGTDLFRLVETTDAQALFEKLARSGILVRPFGTHPTWLRFGLPGDEAGWQRLAAALDI